MKLTVKILQGVECCVEVTEENTIEDLKSAVEKELNIPAGSQRLILKGKTLQDSTVLKEYKIKDGDKVHLSVKNSPPPSKPEDSRAVLEAELKKVLKEHFRGEEECVKITSAILRIIDRKLGALSLDDIERICEGLNKGNPLQF